MGAEVLDGRRDFRLDQPPSAEPASLERVLTRLGRVPHLGGQKLVAGPDGAWLATASEGLVELWDQATRTRLHVFDGMWGDVEGLAVSPKGDWIAAVDGIHMVRLWSIPSYELLLERWAADGERMSWRLTRRAADWSSVGTTYKSGMSRAASGSRF